MTATARDRIAAWQDELAAIRRDIHAHPETALEEVRTAALVAERLRAWGIETTEGVGITGVVGTIRGRLPGQRAVGLRADMDSLFLTERTNLPHASTVAGKMHACGHDGHTTMLLGAARYLAENPDFGGTVHLIFQPAEEGLGGAPKMLADGLFERFPCDAIYALHTLSGIAPGCFATRKGPLLAAADRFRVAFNGTGGHGGATPHLSTDAIVAQANFVMALQTLVARNVSPLDSAVVSVGFVHGGDAGSPNVMPARVELAGTTRSFRPHVRDLIERRIGEIADAIARVHGCTAECEYSRGTMALSNHIEQTDIAVAVARELAGENGVEANMAPITGGEDFSFMLDHVPGAFVFIGNGIGDGPHAAGMHTPYFDFNDAIIPDGAAFFAGVVAQELGSGRGGA
jgi:amidohydrolase